MDLRDAYKQLAISLKDLPLGVVGFKGVADQGPAFYQSLALPFASKLSVFAFNKAGRALEVVMNLVGTT
eukprot:6093016-Amphidinium_carterae.1